MFLFRGGSRGTTNNCVGEQNCNDLLRKTKLKAIFARRALNSPLLLNFCTRIKMT